MMKKVFALLSVLLLFTLTACGGGASDNSNEQGDDKSGKYDNYKSGAFVEIMESGTYYLDSTTYVGGIEASMKLAVDGEDSSVEVSGTGFPIRMLTLDGTLYYMNDERKVYMLMDVEEAPDPEDNGIFDYEGIEYGQNGKGAIGDLAGIDDNAYEYEEFAVGDGEKKVTVRYYFKGDNLYAIEVKLGKASSTMVINELTDQIPSGLLELPDGYNKVDAAGFF